MSKYRTALPQLADRIFLTDGGIETTLIYHDGHRAARLRRVRPARRRRAGAPRLRRYFEPYLRVARDAAWASFSRRRRGGPAATGATCWATRARRSPTVNRAAVELLAELRGRVRHDGFAGRAQRLRRPARRRLPARVADDRRRRRRTTTPSRSARSADASADLVTAITMTHSGEAIGIARAAQRARHAQRHLLHGRDRRSAALRGVAGGGDRDGRRGDRRRRRRTTWSTARTRRTWTRR